MADRARTLLSDIDYRHPRTRVFYWAVFGALVAGSVTTMLPLAWGFMSALKTPDQIFAFPPSFLPQPASSPSQWNWGVYAQVLGGSDFVRYFWNTFLLALRAIRRRCAGLRAPRATGPDAPALEADRIGLCNRN